MRRLSGYIGLLFVLLIGGIKNACAQNRNVLFIGDDRLVLQIDLKSSEKHIDSILRIAGLSSADTKKVLKGDYSSVKKDGWRLSSNKDYVINFERPLTDLNNNPQNTPYQVTTRLPKFDGAAGYPVNVSYGVNKYSRATVYELSSGLTRFILPGFIRARRVFLSGSFNQWSTLKGAMKKADGGWILDVKLEAGAYEYKFIVDSRWMTDPNNLQDVNDGDGNTNSVYYKYNYIIKLPGYASAQKVLIEGDFNKWGDKELAMEKKENGWERQLYLKDGKHVYHFLVDGQAITDPVNTVKTKDEKGNVNSVLNLGETVTFKLSGYNMARAVSVAGSFNKWKAGELNLTKTGDVWTLRTTLAPGNYSYKFIVDGKWMSDPVNPHYVVEKGQANSFLAVRPNYTFRLKDYADAKSVVLTGTFNNWEPNGYTMTHKDDEWVIEFYLKPGKYLYKFRVDGNWIIDPDNKLWEQNQYNTGNSVLWKE